MSTDDVDDDQQPITAVIYGIVATAPVKPTIIFGKKWSPSFSLSLLTCQSRPNSTMRTVQMDRWRKIRAAIQLLSLSLHSRVVDFALDN